MYKEPETETRTYKIEGRPDQLDELEKVFDRTQCLGIIGSSRHIIMFVDGDGAARLKIVKQNGKLHKYDYKQDYLGEQHVASPNTNITPESIVLDKDDLYIKLW